MAQYTDDNPEGLEHGPWEQERLLLLGERYLHVTDKGAECWFDEPGPLRLEVAVVRVPEKGNHYWVWARRGTLVAALMRRIAESVGWTVSPSSPRSDLWSRPAGEWREKRKRKAARRRLRR